jgi:hypothetical protein
MPSKNPGNINPKKPRKPYRFGWADVVIIISVLTIAAIGATVWYGTTQAPIVGRDADSKACIAFNEGLQKAQSAYMATKDAGKYLDEFFAGNDKALEAADPEGALITLLTDVGMQRLSVSPDMGEVAVQYMEQGAFEVQTDCADILDVTIESTPTPTN